MRSARTLPVLLCALAIAAPAAAQKLYKYTDPVTGKVVYTDKVPTEAAGKANEQLNPQGTVVRRNEAALTPEQLAAREAERKRKLEEDMAAKEEKRKKQAILNTYSSEKDIDDARVRAHRANEDAIKEAEQKLAAAQRRQQQLASETEFYKAKSIPAKLKQEIQLNEIELRSHAELLERKKKETEVINAKYDEDLRRYREVAQTGVTASGRAAPVAAVPPRPATKN